MNNKLLQTGEYTAEKKEVSRRTSYFAGAYWCIITTAYLGFSLYTRLWHSSWILWPVAGVLFAAFQHILNAVAERKKYR